jgi:hypothetical protein
MRWKPLGGTCSRKRGINPHLERHAGVAVAQKSKDGRRSGGRDARTVSSILVWVLGEAIYSPNPLTCPRSRCIGVYAASEASEGETQGRPLPPAINPDQALPGETAVDRGVPHTPHEQRTGAQVTASDRPQRWRNAWQWGGPNRRRKAPAPPHSRPY